MIKPESLSLPLVHPDDHDVKRVPTIDEIQSDRLAQIRAESAATRAKIASRGFLPDQLGRTSDVQSVAEAQKKIFERLSKSAPSIENS